MSNLNEIAECANCVETMISTYLPIIIAIFLGYIAYEQMRTNRNKLKLDLYNKRFDIYSSALKFYQEITAGESSKTTRIHFIIHKESARFLFSNTPKIYNILDGMHEKSFVIISFKENSSELKNSPDAFTKAMNESNEALKWFGGIMPELNKEMGKYLRFN